MSFYTICLELQRGNRCKKLLRCRKLTPLLLLLSVSFLISCAHNFSSFDSVSGEGLYTAAAFGPGGKLWRVRPSKHHVYVDYSIDKGKTFSAPVIINPESQRIKASVENRPGIAVDGENRIFVIYPAEGDKQPSEVYFSISADGGKHFSAPKAVSDKAFEANAFQGRLALSPHGRTYVFWHDERDKIDWKEVGNAIYYTTLDAAIQSSAPGRKAADSICECCKIAADFEADGEPVLFARFVYPGGIRDHGLIEPAKGGGQWISRRVTFDEWHIEGCPEHGPAISISGNGEYHIVWFTQGTARQGLFYAYSTDGGHHFSTPMPFGTTGKLPGHPDVIALKQQVVLTWTEFNGSKTQLLTMQSKDGGRNWSQARVIAETNSEADAPLLLQNNGDIFVSWNTGGGMYRLISVGS